MTTFAILTPPNSPQMQGFEQAIERVFPNAFFSIAAGQYVAARASATSEQIAREMGADGEIGRFVVFTVAGQWGFHTKGLWEWLAAQERA